MTTKIKCLAVDDEPLALELVKGYIEQTPFLELAGTCDNALESITFLENNEVELIFLDIQMPGLTGTSLIFLRCGRWTMVSCVILRVPVIS